MRVQTLLYPVDDLETTLCFFRDALALPLKFRDGDRYAAFDAGGITLGLVSGDERLIDSPALALRVDDIDAAMTQLSANGAVVLRPVECGPHERRAVLRAPDGQTLVLTTRLDTPSIDTALDAETFASKITCRDDNMICLLGRAWAQIYRRIHRLARRNGLSGRQYFTLAILGLRDGQSRADINETFIDCGYQARESDLHQLANFGLLHRCSMAMTARYYLTRQGRQLALRVITAIEEIEAGVLADFEEDQALSLRRLLRQFIRITDAGDQRLRKTLNPLPVDESELR